MLRFDEIVFGPIRSRRLGSSLGVNLLPAKGKLCNFDCIYCECGWNEDGRCDTVLPGTGDVAAALESRLKDCLERGVCIDSITFSGHGEPTLHPGFAEIIELTVGLRDRYCPGAVVSVLSNATMLDRDDVVEALRKVDNPILKLDAVSGESAWAVNRPQGAWKVEKVVEGMKKFNGNFILQTMFLSAPDFDTADIVEEWMEIVREVRPRRLMIYTLDRETPQKGLGKYSVAQMKALTAPLAAEGFDIQING